MRIGLLGAGIGGLAVATLLQRSGHDVCILERYPKPQAVGAGLLLQPPGQKVLQDLGVYGQLKAKSSVITRLESLTKQGKPILDVRYDADDDKKSADFGLGVHRPVLYQLLVDTALDSGCQIKNSHAVRGVEQTNAGVKVQCGEGTLSFDYVIVATGAQSDWIETQQVIKRTIKPYRWGCLWANVEWVNGDLETNILHQRCSKADKMMGLLPTSSIDGATKKAALYWSVDLLNWKKSKTEFCRAQMINVWPETREILKNTPADNFQLARYFDVWCGEPVVGRVALIGDAAHGTSPQLGQGVTMALLDAAALASSLNDFHVDHPEFSSLVANAYKHQRLGHQRYVRLASKVLTPFFQSHSATLSFIRDRTFSATLGVPPFKGITKRTLSSSFYRRGPG